MSNRPSIGQPISRLEGQMKVTGSAKYSGEYNVPGLLYGYVVNSTIVRGEIISINTAEVKTSARCYRNIYARKPAVAGLV